MKCKWLKNLIFLLFAVALYILLIFRIFKVQYYSAIENIIMPLIFGIGGILFSILENAFLHEVGHLIFGKIAGLKLISIKILWFKLSFENKIKFTLEKANDLGETVFVPKNDKKVSSKVAFSIFGGLLFSILLLAKRIIYYYCVIYIPFELPIGLDLLWVVFEICFAGYIVVTLYYLVVNLVGDETCDGYRLLELLNKKNNNKIISSNALYIGSLLYNGVSPTEIDYKYLSVYNQDYSLYSTLIIYYRYLSLISINEEYAFKEILKISDKDKLANTLFDVVMCELYYVAFIKDDKIFLKNNKAIIEKIVEYDDSLYSLRAHAVLRIFNNENEWAKILIDQALTQIGDQESGILAVEKPLFNKLKEKIN